MTCNCMPLNCRGVKLERFRKWKLSTLYSIICSFSPSLADMWYSCCVMFTADGRGNVLYMHCESTDGSSWPEVLVHTLLPWWEEQATAFPAISGCRGLLQQGSTSSLGLSWWVCCCMMLLHLEVLLLTSHTLDNGEWVQSTTISTIFRTTLSKLSESANMANSPHGWWTVGGPARDVSNDSDVTWLRRS